LFEDSRKQNVAKLDNFFKRRDDVYVDELNISRGVVTVISSVFMEKHKEIDHTFIF
jgi:hypothetical protein